jgi:hypothetical protein
MRVHLICIIYLLTTIASGQTEDTKVVAKITSLPVEDGQVTVLHLGPGYTTSVRLPEEISSVVIGDPASFKAEHSEAEPRLVFLKPVTSKPSESNALITTKSGREISLQLVSAGKETNSRVDFVVEYRRTQDLIIASGREDFLISETQPVSLAGPANSPPVAIEKVNPMEQELRKQQGLSLSLSNSTGKALVASVGESVERNHQTILGFSVVNRSKRVIELLPPQMELSSGKEGKGGKRIKAEPVPIAEFRMTARRLEPGSRADGVVVFERPAFKESQERLELELAQADQVDRPIVLPVPFTANSEGGAQ